MCVEIDDHVIPSGRPRPGQPKRLSDAELACLAVAQVLLGARSEHHWLRMCYARRYDPVRLIDATLVPCGASRETVKRSEPMACGKVGSDRLPAAQSSVAGALLRAAATADVELARVVITDIQPRTPSMQDA